MYGTFQRLKSSLSRQSTCDSVVVDFGGLTQRNLRELQGLRGTQLCERITQEYGSVERLSIRLGSNPHKGLTGEKGNIRQRRKEFGSNYIEPKKPKAFYLFIWEAFQDLTLIILTIAAIVSLGLSFYHAPKTSENGTVVEDPTKGLEWIEGAAILAAVVVIVLVTAVNNWSKEKQFRGLQKTIADNQTFATLRASEIVQLPKYDLVVGDICLFKYGDTVPSDGLIVQSNDVKVDESSLTGETNLVKKGVATDPLLFSGSHIMEGSGRMVVIAVGINSLSGRVMRLMGGTASKKRKKSEGVNGVKKPLENGSYKEKEEKEEEEEEEDEDDDDDDEEFSVKSILRSKLDKLAMQIGYAGLAAALATLIALILRLCIQQFIILKLPWSNVYIQEFVSFIIISITIIVVAIPEGLPLAVMLSLAYSVKKMMSDNNLVRHLDACETMGSATTICSDKTGTLTMNRMTVVKCFISDKTFEKRNDFKDFPHSLTDLLAVVVTVNTNYTSRVIFESKSSRLYSRQIGNKTECALLGFVHDLGLDCEVVRQRITEDKFRKVYTFSSAQKRMSTVVPSYVAAAVITTAAAAAGNERDGYMLFTKGASELLLRRCRWIVGPDGAVVPFPVSGQDKMIEEVIGPWSSEGLRTICVAYREFAQRMPGDAATPDGSDHRSYFDLDTDLDWDNEEFIVSDLVCLCIVGIEDPLRAEVPRAIRRCQAAGITVRMVTGDNVNTARSIAVKCGILNEKDDFLVLEGPEFNKRIRSKPQGPVEQSLLDEIWPRLRVLARSSPEDKYNLVKGIMDSKLTENREVVAVTGDGTNDGPALKKADVGFAMGIAGTDVAKEASDIILMDDNFSSIVKAVVWGRHVYDSIAKFLQFQLTVNIVAVSISFLGACIIADTPLKAVQMMWVNLLQDTLASLSLATELPTDELLKRKPYSRHQSILSMSMLFNILVHSVYQLIVLLFFLFAGDSFFDIDSGRDPDMRGIPTQHFTFIFNILVMMTLFNEFNCRKLNGSLNVFSGIHRSHLFLVIWITSFILQVVIIQYGGYAFFTEELSADQWLWCILFGVGELVFAQIVVMVRLLIDRLRKGEEVSDETARTNIVFIWSSQMSDKLVTSTDA